MQSTWPTASLVAPAGKLAKYWILTAKWGASNFDGRQDERRLTLWPFIISHLYHRFLSTIFAINRRHRRCFWSLSPDSLACRGLAAPFFWRPSTHWAVRLFFCNLQETFLYYLLRFERRVCRKHFDRNNTFAVSRGLCALFVDRTFWLRSLLAAETRRLIERSLICNFRHCSLITNRINANCVLPNGSGDAPKAW